MLEAFFAPIAFTLIVLVALGWALARRIRRPQSGTGHTGISKGEPTDDANSERRRYGS